MLIGFCNSTMDKFSSLLFVYFILMVVCCYSADEDRKVHIVYMGSLPRGDYLPSSHHHRLLQNVVDGSSVTNYLVRSYKRSFNGFAAKLTDNEAQKLASLEEVVSVFPSRALQLQTTRSWDFMGFYQNITQKPTVESDVIIGVIDTGIWPESESFSDKGFGPPPKKWKGSCKGGTNFTCNNKIIGAQFYGVASDSARDNIGHGSHTASTAAGIPVDGVSFYGLAQGTARGGAPSARISVYKVCNDECNSEDILSAFDDAIADGVDIITISIGRDFGEDFSGDTIAIGAFHAMEKGIITVHSAGNNGPSRGLVNSVAPWLFSIAASSTDRRIIDKVVLGNGKTLVGNSINSFTLNGTKFPLIYANTSSLCPPEEAGLCIAGCLDSKLVNGKIVLCDSFQGYTEAQTAGAVGSILANTQDDVSFVFSLPGLGLSSDDYDAVKSYATTTRKAKATILKSEDTTDSTAPVVAAFSSRGPNAIATDILKPDISAPGVDILAAYAPTIPPSSVPADKRSVKYNILSGTSMACPHAAGVAAYVKAFHPDWSPSAIKSAIMTTAKQMNATTNQDGEFAYGSGHINPLKAINPGLVYEALAEDYIKMLCSMGYSEKKLRLVTGDKTSCPKGAKKGSPKNLNYPSMAAQVSTNKFFKIKFQRTVTNVGIANSTYTAKITSNPQLHIKVHPKVLSFKALNEKKSFLVTVVGEGLSSGTLLSASLEWFDGTHSVRSPIIAYTKSNSTTNLITV